LEKERRAGKTSKGALQIVGPLAQTIKQQITLVSPKETNCLNLASPRSLTKAQFQNISFKNKITSPQQLANVFYGQNFATDGSDMKQKNEDSAAKFTSDQSGHKVRHTPSATSRVNLPGNRKRVLKVAEPIQRSSHHIS